MLVPVPSSLGCLKDTMDRLARVDVPSQLRSQEQEALGEELHSSNGTFTADLTSMSFLRYNWHSVNMHLNLKHTT